ncbi:MAG: F420-dependent methylenetetrahydromethanopterin dehydrogenase [Candidatus Thorarchaeota archaeon]
MTEKKDSPKTKIVILKLGNIASSVLLEMLLDERADRTDLEVRTISSGAKLENTSISDAYNISKNVDCDLILITTPNASLPNTMKLISKVKEKKLPTIIISDILKDESIEIFKKENIGYLMIKADAMIGARREFLDPMEMVLYNSDLLKVLAVGGVLNLIYHEIDAVIEQISRKETVILPQIKVTSASAVKYAGFSNPYAEVKARGALEIAEKVSDINHKGCFKINDREEYITQVATGHEMMRNAAQLADDAREIEKINNRVRRQPHSYEGEIQEKITLTEKPSSKYK